MESAFLFSTKPSLLPFLTSTHFRIWTSIQLSTRTRLGISWVLELVWHSSLRSHKPPATAPTSYPKQLLHDFWKRRWWTTRYNHAAKSTHRELFAGLWQQGSEITSSHVPWKARLRVMRSSSNLPTRPVWHTKRGSQGHTSSRYTLIPRPRSQENRWRWGCGPLAAVRLIWGIFPEIFWNRNRVGHNLELLPGSQIQGENCKVTYSRSGCFANSVCSTSKSLAMLSQAPVPSGESSRLWISWLGLQPILKPNTGPCTEITSLFHCYD